MISRAAIVLLFVTFASVNGANDSCTNVCPCQDRKVFCGARHFYNIPRDIPSKTKHLDFRNNELPIVTIAMMKRFKNLRTLMLGTNKIQHVQPRSFDRMSRMKYLDLNKNELQHISIDIFAKLTDVRVILIGENNIEDIETMFVNNPRLQTIGLRHNRIKRITNETFANNAKLKFLDLTGNLITYIDPNAFVKMRTLKYLFLNHNQLHALHTLFIPSRNLVMLDVTNCSLTTMIKGLPRSVRDLRYEFNNITNVTADDIRNTTKLGFLTFSWNNLTHVDDMILVKLKYIYNLYLDNNRLSNVPRRLPPNARTLFFQRNRITQLPGHVFKSLRYLETIDLHKNKIGRIHGAAFNGLTTLRNLKLSDNNIEWLKRNLFKDLKSLDSLDLSRNPIVRIDGNALHGLRNMLILQMSELPNVTSMGRHVFAEVKNLHFLDLNASPKISQEVVSRDIRHGYLEKVEDLNLMNNGLHRLSRDFPYHLPALRVIKLTKNPWICNKPLSWMQTWLKNKTVDFFQVNNIRCASPEQLKRRALLHLASWEFKNENKFTKPPTYDERENSVIPLEVDVDLEAMFEISMEGETFQTMPTNEDLRLKDNINKNSDDEN